MTWEQKFLVLAREPFLVLSVVGALVLILLLMVLPKGERRIRSRIGRVVNAVLFFTFVYTLTGVGVLYALSSKTATAGREMVYHANLLYLAVGQEENPTTELLQQMLSKALEEGDLPAILQVGEAVELYLVVPGGENNQQLHDLVLETYQSADVVLDLSAMQVMVREWFPVINTAFPPITFACERQPGSLCDWTPTTQQGLTLASIHPLLPAVLIAAMLFAIVVGMTLKFQVEVRPLVVGSLQPRTSITGRELTAKTWWLAGLAFAITTLGPRAKMKAAAWFTKRRD